MIADLGNANWSMVPKQRGFDEYRGYWGGGMPFWTKKSGGNQGSYYDMHLGNGDITDQESLATTMCVSPPPRPPFPASSDSLG